MTLSLGVYNDWFTTEPTWEDSGTTVAGRITGLAWIDTSGRRFLHLAGAFRRNGADEGKLRFKGRPESNVADNYVDTVDIPASHANQYGLEALWNEGPFSLTAEYGEAQVDSPETGDPQFRGYYATGAWIVAGEHRPYARKVGDARRVTPRGRWGAVELVARSTELSPVPSSPSPRGADEAGRDGRPGSRPSPPGPCRRCRTRA